MDALVKALGPVGMVRFLQRCGPEHVDYTAQRHAILGSPTVEELMDEVERREEGSEK